MEKNHHMDRKQIKNKERKGRQMFTWRQAPKSILSSRCCSRPDSPHTQDQVHLILCACMCFLCKSVVL